MFMLHLPDFLGYESAIEHGRRARPTWSSEPCGSRKLGNDLVALLGGRSVHPVGVCVGGFYRSPDPARIARLLPELRACLDDMCELTLMLAREDRISPSWSATTSSSAFAPTTSTP